MAVNKGVVNTNICQPTEYNQRVDRKPFDQDFKISAEECGIAAFLDQTIIG